MSPLAASTAVLLIGAMLLRLVITGAYQNYVRAAMAPWLLISGLALLALGSAGVWRAFRAPPEAPAPDVARDAHDGDAHDGAGGDGRGGVGHDVFAHGAGGHDAGGHDAAGHDAAGHDAAGHDAVGHGAAGHGAAGHDAAGLVHDGHDHEAGAGVGWLLIVPVAALLMITPPSLGSFGISSGPITIAAGRSVFRPVPHSTTPVPMTLLEFGQRGVDHAGASLGDQPVALTGFVATGALAAAASSGQSGFRIGRYQIACCAADGVASLVSVTGVSGAAPAKDSWVRVVGTFAGVDRQGAPILAATSLEVVPAPVDPYESA